MSRTKIFIAVALINVVIIAGIVNELGLGDEEVDTSTIVTAKLSISYSNAGDNDTLVFESITTTESTVFGLLMSGSNEGSYEVKTTNDGQGVTVTDIIIDNFFTLSAVKIVTKGDLDKIAKKPTNQSK